MKSTERLSKAKEIKSLEELKSIELNIMKKIHHFCEKNDIVYYLSFGTLIGAVRHDGFIPWDDDIDIYMMRTDYEKFLSLFSDCKDSLGLEIANHKTSTYYGRNMTKVFDTRTILMEPEYKTDDPIGVFIDVWPLDSLPNSALRTNIVLKKAFWYKKILLASSMNTSNRFSFKKNLIIRMASIINPKAMINKLERLIEKYRDDDSEFVFCFAGQDAVYRRSLFRTRKLHKFEDTEFYIPEMYDEILTLEFGNYMKLPPENQREPHHVINTYYR